MHYSRFAVGNDPWCVWEWDLPQRNLEFIEAISPEYYEHLAELSFGETEGEKGRLAAITLRLGYGQALESFFALLCATLQAPDCVAGWLSKYKVSQLHGLVRDITAGRQVLNKLALPEVSWTAISEAMICPKLVDQAHEAAVKQGFARMWARFAEDFGDSDQSHEYNCIKHGLRIQPGGFYLRVGRESEYGVRPQSEHMKSVGGSRFGCQLLKPEPIGEHKRNFRIRKHARNWSIENLAYGILHLASSMRNVLAFLRFVNGADPETISFTTPRDVEEFNAPWRKSVGTRSMNLDTVIADGDIRPQSKEAILEVYEKSDKEVQT